MYQVLIAEDEVLTRAGIAATADWGALGMEVVAQAGDGLQALEQFRQYSPDVVITDLNMPYLDGVKLISQIHREKPSCKIIVITCIDDADTIRRLFPYGITDFFEKSEISAPALTKCLRKVKRELDLARAEGHEAERLSVGTSASGAFPGGAGDGAAINDRCLLFRLETGVKDKTLLKNTVASLVSEYFLPENGAFCSMRNDTDFAVCFHNPDMTRETILHRSALFREYVLKALNVDLFCSVESCGGKGGVAARCRDFFSLVGHVRIPERGVFEDQDARFRSRAERIAGLYALNAFCGETRKTYGRAVADPLLRLSRQPDFGFAQYQNAVTEGFRTFFLRTGALSPEEEERFESALLAEDTFEGIFLLCGKTVFGKKERFPDDLCCKEEIRTALEYIRSHCNEKITLDTAAKATALSPNYFSSLFKRDVGESFVAYLTDCRMLRALRLLADRNMYLYEVAEKVGIPDVSYFSKTFKSATGFSPYSWRKLLTGLRPGESRS